MKLLPAVDRSPSSAELNAFDRLPEYAQDRLLKCFGSVHGAFAHGLVIRRGVPSVPVVGGSWCPLDFNDL